MTAPPPAPFLAAAIRPGFRRLVVLVLGVFIATAPAVIITKIVSGLDEAGLKDWFGEYDNMRHWVLAGLGHAALTGLLIGVLSLWTGRFRPVMTMLIALLALALDAAATAFWWIGMMLTHPHGFR